MKALFLRKFCEVSQIRIFTTKLSLWWKNVSWNSCMELNKLYTFMLTLFWPVCFFHTNKQHWKQTSVMVMLIFILCCFSHQVVGGREPFFNKGNFRAPIPLHSHPWESAGALTLENKISKCQTLKKRLAARAFLLKLETWPAYRNFPDCANSGREKGRPESLLQLFICIHVWFFESAEIRSFFDIPIFHFLRTILKLCFKETRRTRKNEVTLRRVSISYEYE